MPTKQKKTEAKAETAKPIKELSLRRMSEDEHRLGKHKATTHQEAIDMASANNDCGFCIRREMRYSIPKK